MEKYAPDVRVRLRVPTDDDATTIEAVAAYLRFQHEHPTLPRLAFQPPTLAPIAVPISPPPSPVPLDTMSPAPGWHLQPASRQGAAIGEWPALVAPTLPSAAKRRSAARRLILVTGGKGGVGCSITAGLLSAWYDELDLEYSGYDATLDAPDFQQFCAGPVTPVEMQDLASIAPVLDRLLDGTGSAIAVLDVPTRTNQCAFQWLQEAGALRAVVDGEIEITVLFLIEGTTTSVERLAQAVQIFGKRVHWIVAKNMNKAWEFDYYDRSSARKELLSIGAAEINVPSLDTDLFQKIDRLGIPFRVARDKVEHLGRTQANVVRVFLQNAFEQFEACADWLRDR